MSRILYLVTVEPGDDPTYVQDEIQAHLESLGFQHVDVERRDTWSVDNSGEELRP